MSQQTPKQIGKYQVIRRLGGGGMAEVFEAYDDSVNRYVALKVLHGKLTENSEAVQSFLREARKVVQLEQHDAILTVYEVDLHNGSPFIAMQKVDGGSLEELLERRGVLDIDVVRSVIGRVGGALGCAHDHHIVHCDVKPSNILLDRLGMAYLADFGISRVVGDALSASTEAGSGCTPRYASPEQLEGVAANARSDVYSLGVVLFRMCTGSMPFPGVKTIEELRQRVVNQEPPDPRSINERIQPALGEAILKAMARDPRRRFASAHELMRAVLQATDGGSTAAVADSTKPPLAAGEVTIPPQGTARTGPRTPPPVRAARSPAPSAQPPHAVPQRGHGTAVVAGLAAVVLLGGAGAAWAWMPDDQHKQRDDESHDDKQAHSKLGPMHLMPTPQPAPPPLEAPGSWLPASALTVLPVLQVWQDSWLAAIDGALRNSCSAAEQAAFRLLDRVRLTAREAPARETLRELANDVGAHLLLRIRVDGQPMRSTQGLWSVDLARFEIDLWSAETGSVVATLATGIAEPADADGEQVLYRRIGDAVAAVVGGRLTALADPIHAALERQRAALERDGLVYAVQVVDPGHDSDLSPALVQALRADPRLGDSRALRAEWKVIQVCKQSRIVRVEVDELAPATAEQAPDPESDRPAVGLPDRHLRVLAADPDRAALWEAALREVREPLGVTTVQRFEAAGSEELRAQLLQQAGPDRVVFYPGGHPRGRAAARDLVRHLGRYTTAAAGDGQPAVAVRCRIEPCLALPDGTGVPGRPVELVLVAGSGTADVAAAPAADKPSGPVRKETVEIETRLAKVQVITFHLRFRGTGLELVDAVRRALHGHLGSLRGVAVEQPGDAPRPGRSYVFLLPD